MKKILVLTDFSNNALNAAEAAVILAGKIHANLLIMNSDNSIALIPYYKDVPLITEIVSWDKVQREHTLSHQHHTYFMRMLKEDTVMMSIKQQKNPILVFPLVELQKTKIDKTTLGYIL
jgi:galactose-1-phosphate uridylyltransferase